LVVLYLVGKVQPPGQPHLDDQLRAALPGCTIVAYTQADGEPLSTTRLRVERARGAPLKGRVALVGYSLGVSRGVRQRLRDGAKPDALLCIDGTHASYPAADWQLDIWRPFIADARAGKRLVVMTCTGQTYTERLPAAKRFQSTLNTLRQLSRWPLDQPEPLPLGEVHSDGDFHVHNYASQEIDATAHSKQLTHVLPEMVRRYLTPWLAQHRAPTSDRPTPIEAETTPIPDAPTSNEHILKRGMMDSADVALWQTRLHELGFECGTIDGDFGQLTEIATKQFQRVAGLLATGQVDKQTRETAENTEGVTVKMPSTAPRTTGDPVGLSAKLLEQARTDLGVREETPNDGRRIRQYFAGTGVTPPAHWCAAAMRFWLRTAAHELRVEPPIKGSVGAKVWMQQLEKAGRWIHAVDLRREPHRLRPGMIVVWHRGAPNAATGHIGVVATVTGAWKFTTIEGNSGDRSNEVAERSHNLSDGNLLGAGHLD
jgi:peptidoglycan hydrolase-like protein with peptidoglycan-binding domain